MSEQSPDFGPHGYEVVRRLGHNLAGGRVTYLAKQLSSDRQVVIKQFSFARVDAGWAGYKAHERELELLERIEHERVPDIVDHFATDDGFCLVQAYLEHPNLAQDKRGWDAERVESMARDLLSILVDLQKRKPMILHRDIKPENVLIDARDRVYLIDFGFGRVGEKTSASSIAVGTPGFMAPEQLLGKEMNEATDVYGVGMTAIALLSGAESDEVGQLVDETMQVSLGKLHRNTPEYLRRWLGELVHPKNSARPRDAKAALQRLDELKRQGADQGRSDDFAVPKIVPLQPTPVASDKQLQTKLVGVAGFLLLVIGVLTYEFVADKGEKASAFLQEEPSQGERFVCRKRGEVRVEASAGLTRLDEVTIQDGCKLIVKGMGLGSVLYHYGASFELEDVVLEGEVKSAGKFEGDSPPKGQAIFRKVKAGADVRLRGFNAVIEGLELTAPDLALDFDDSNGAVKGLKAAKGGGLRAHGRHTQVTVTGPQVSFISVYQSALLVAEGFGKLDALMVENTGDGRSEFKASTLIAKKGLTKMLSVGWGSQLHLKDAIVSERVDVKFSPWLYVENSKITASDFHSGSGSFWVVRNSELPDGSWQKDASYVVADGTTAELEQVGMRAREANGVGLALVADVKSLAEDLAMSSAVQP